MRRDEFDRSTNGDPHEIWYHYATQERGYIGNNGTFDVDDTTSIAQRTAAQGTGAFGQVIVAVLAFVISKVIDRFIPGKW